MYIDKGKVMNSVWRGAILTSLTKHTYDKNKPVYFYFVFSKSFYEYKVEHKYFSLSLF